MSEESEAQAPSERGPASAQQSAPDAPAAPATGMERGQPSPHLQRAMTPEDGGEYETITDAAPEKGLFRIVGGYLDDAGVVHNEVHMRAMSGEEEEILGNRAIPFFDRLHTIASECVTRIGSIVDKGQIIEAMSRLPISSRAHLLICLRRVSHWKSTKDIYDMEVRCPIRTCQKEGSYKVDLSNLDVYEMPDPTKREHEVVLPYSEEKVVWRVAAKSQEKIMTAVAELDDTKALTWSIVTRIVSVNGEDKRIGIPDALAPDHKQIKLSKKASDLVQWARKLSTGDRDALREDFLDKEPDVDTSLQLTCKHCKREIETSLDIYQEAFWFPSVTSRRSKKKPSI